MSTSETFTHDVVVLLPAKNEALTIRESISRFSQCLPNAHVVVIDNNSTDLTASIAEQAIEALGVNGQVIKEYKTGKGNAVWAGLHAAEATVYVMCDSDCTYPIEDVHRIIAPIVLGQADLVIGDRLSNSVYKKQNRRRFHGIGNDLLTSLINVFFARKYADVASGFKAFSRRFVDTYSAHVPGFEIEVDLAIHAAVSSFVSIDVPITYQSRPAGSFSKLNTFRDGFTSIKRIFSRYISYQYSKLRDR